MSKLIAAINMTLDGYCDHTAVNPDDEVHNYYTELLKSAGCLLYGRITYQLMEFWKELFENPSGDESMDRFARAMNTTPKVVFSKTLTHIDWSSARLAKQSLYNEVTALKKEYSGDIYAGSPGIIVSLTNLKLIDEFQILVHPVLAKEGLPLFSKLSEKMLLQLKSTQTFSGGAVLLNYKPLYHQ